MEIKKCKYCGATIKGQVDICNNCIRKRPLVRQLLQMVKDTYEMKGVKTKHG